MVNVMSEMVILSFYDRLYSLSLGHAAVIPMILVLKSQNSKKFTCASVKKVIGQNI